MSKEQKSHLPQTGGPNNGSISLTTKLNSSIAQSYGKSKPRKIQEPRIHASITFHEPTSIMMLADAEDEYGSIYTCAVVIDDAGIRVVSPDREMPRSVREMVLETWCKEVGE